MGWLQWAIPLIGLAVWILSNLIKNQQDEARRREMQMRTRPTMPEETPVRKQPPPLVERPRKIERPRPPLRPEPEPVQERSRPRPEPQPVRPSRRQAPAPAETVVTAQLVVPVAEPVSSAPTVTANRKATKAIQNLHILLKNRNSLATAFLLTEVIGKPKCKLNEMLGSGIRQNSDGLNSGEFSYPKSKS